MATKEATKKSTGDMTEHDIWFRSCLKEVTTPITGKLSGKVPSWLEGSLLRNGPGLFEIGDTEFKHLFDGMALLHRYHVSNGKVTYNSKFLRSDRYKVHTEANRIVMAEFGTLAYPDPCKTMWQRFMSRFESDSMMIDNCNVTVCPYGEEIYVATERKNMWRVDPNTLDTKEKTDVGKYVAVSHAIAHTHCDKDGTVYNIGSSFAKGPLYNIIKFPPAKEEKGEQISTFKQAVILASIPSRWSYHPTYYHSFAITEKYVVFMEQPLCISIPQMATSRIRNSPSIDSIVWYDNYQVRFHLVNKATGAIQDLHWESSDPFFYFHTICAYDDDDHVVIDICAGKDATAFFDTYRHQAATHKLSESTTNWWLGGTPRRFVLPLKPDKDAAPGTNLVKLSYTKATATWDKNRIICASEDFPDIAFEFPRINYSYNGQKYRYFYGMNPGGIFKADWETRKATWWKESDIYPTEPIFVENPNGTKEDDGVVLSALLKRANPNEVDLLILDARNMTEIARASFTTPSAVPSTFHGIFLHPERQGANGPKKANGY